jgi:hypothetical protein
VLHRSQESKSAERANDSNAEETKPGASCFFLKLSAAPRGEILIADSSAFADQRFGFFRLAARSGRDLSDSILR